jgi:hypothetical protein
MISSRLAIVTKWNAGSGCAVYQLCGSSLRAVIGEVLVVAPAANDWARRNRVGSRFPVFAVIGFTALSALLESMLLGVILGLSLLYVVNLRLAKAERWIRTCT